MDKLKTFEPISLKKSKINDSFWSEYVKLVQDVVIPYQWEALNDNIADAEPSYAIKNFKVAAGELEGEFGGMVFQDSDLAKWLEAVGYSLAIHPDKKLEQMADSVIDLIGKAQMDDGYINTYFTLKAPDKRWTNLWECHELYCAGHMIEAAVAYYNATGKRKFLDIMCRFADYIDTVFGPEPEKLRGYPGHEEIELALVKLYKVTGNEKYLNLSKYFIDERGKEPNYFIEEWEKRGHYSHWTKGPVSTPDTSYNQAHVPVREQKEAVGHSVRAVYLYTAMADLAAETGDVKLLEACRNLWQDIVKKKMYITGGIGSTVHGEAFTFAYDLPNDTVYAETCASIGLIFFAHRMLQIEAKSEYADVIERALYNVVTSSMALDGAHFFYVNPLDVWPEASKKNPGRRHVKPVRQKWFGCACCPPNVSRLLASLGQYIYTQNEDSIYAHLYIGGESEFEIKNQKVKLMQNNNYPWSGNISFKVSTENSLQFTLALRIPVWCRKHKISINGCEFNPEYADGYALINAEWENGDSVELELDMPVEFLVANPKVRANCGKIALQRGPLVYCIEEADNGANLSALSICTDAELTEGTDSELPEGTVTLESKGFRTSDDSVELYSSLSDKDVPVNIKAVPYFVWGNRKPGEMLVWVRYK
jgi:uncharacterized protein